MTTTDRRTPASADQTDTIVPCGFAADGLCNRHDELAGRCETCERYNDLLRRARELYVGVVWAVNPDGLLQEVR
jgi:hypothetical protein